jgi:hypothetical protein
MAIAHLSWWFYASAIGFLVLVSVTRFVAQLVTQRLLFRSAKAKVIFKKADKFVVADISSSDVKKIVDSLVTAIGNTEPREIRPR